MDVLLRGVRIVPLDGEEAPGVVDVRVSAGRVAEIGAGLSGRGEEIEDAAGAWLLPGLWDAHVHATQAARAASWLDLRRTASGADVVERVRARLGAEVAPVAKALIGIGYRSSGWSEPASVAALDAASGGRPVVLIAGDAHNGWLNTAAQRLLGVGPFAGAVFEDEWFAIFSRLGELTDRASDDAALASWLGDAAARGITGLVDLEFGDAFADWPGRVARGLDGVRVRAGVYPHQLDVVAAAGLRTGDVLDAAGLVAMGPLKVIGDGSLGSGTAWCFDPDASGRLGAPNLPSAELVGLLQAARRGGLDASVHAIGDRACRAALDAFAATGAQGTVEHAQLVADADLPRFAALGVAASVQPLHLLDDRDSIDRLWPGRGARCFPLRSLADAGTKLRLGSDAPIAPVDPWGAIDAAVHRGAWHPEQCLTVREALAASVDGGRVRVGAPADLVLVGADPYAVDDLAAMPVLATLCAGRFTHRV